MRPLLPRLVAGLLICAAIGWPQKRSAAQTEADRLIQAEIGQFNAQISGERDAATLIVLLQLRARRMGELMERNPVAAVESALPDGLRQTLASTIPAATEWLEEKGQWTGPLVVAIADNSKTHRTQTIQTLRIDGHPLTLYSESPNPTCARSASAQGIRLGNRIAAASVQVEDAAPACPTTGDQKTAVLMINYQSYSITPGYTADFLNNSFFGPAPSVTDYWNDASYGTTSTSGDVFGPFNLNTNFACNQQEQILQAAIAAADPTVDFTAYNRIFLILPVTVAGGCVYDGLAYVGCTQLVSPSKGPFTASVTWLETPTLGPNVFGLLGEFVQTLIHEGGHNFGLRHSNSLDYDTLPVGAVDADGAHVEYGDPFSSMGSNPGHFAAPHKNMLGWLNEGSGYETVQSEGTWTLTPLSQNSGALHALRVQRGTGTDQWLWIEYRQPIGNYEPTVIDTGAPRDFNGVLIHMEDPALTTNWPGYANLLTFQPVRLPNDFNQALLQAGTVWTDPYTNLTLTTGAATPSGIPVTVSYDNGCATLTTNVQSFGASGGAGAINVQASQSCSWTAATAAEWITFTGTTSGAGPGTVPYTVTSNSSSAARSSFVSISHQTFTVNEAVEPQGGAVSLAPGSGTGASKAFSFQFADPTSWSNLQWGEININTAQVTANSCYIQWVAAGNQIYLRDNADANWLGPVSVGASGTLANGQCILHPDTATVAGAGTTATLTLQIDFTNRFASDQKNVYMQSQSQTTACGWQQAGTWTVSFPFEPVSVSPAGSSGTQELFTFTMEGFYPLSDYYDGDQVNLAFSTSTAFGTLQFYDYGCALVFGPAMTDLFLFADMASDSTGTSGTLGSSIVLANSQCSVDLARSSAQLSGSTLSLQLAISFKPAFVGEQNIYEFGPGTGWPLGASYSPVGTFTVTTSPRRPRL